MPSALLPRSWALPAATGVVSHATGAPGSSPLSRGLRLGPRHVTADAYAPYVPWHLVDLGRRLPRPAAQSPWSLPRTAASGVACASTGAPWSSPLCPGSDGCFCGRRVGRASSPKMLYSIGYQLRRHPAMRLYQQLVPLLTGWDWRHPARAGLWSVAGEPAPCPAYMGSLSGFHVLQPSAETGQVKPWISIGWSARPLAPSGLHRSSATGVRQH